MEQGKIINGVKSKTWIERYEKAGEFKFIANANSGVRELLPIGSFVSHVDTKEVMIVENHEISDDQGKETEVIITGRGFESFLENRIVGSNKVFPATEGVTDYVLAANTTWIQTRTLIGNHIYVAPLIDDGNAIPYVEAVASVSGAGSLEERTVKTGDLYSRVQELLAIDRLGIKIVRPGYWGPLSPAIGNLAIIIHKGVDRTNSVIFSYDTGEIESADYLWSNKKVKNCALVSGRWVETFVNTTKEGYERRMMHVDASDIDNAYSEAPTGGDLTQVVNAMNQRGIAALAAQTDVALTKAEVSRQAVKTVYRTDFDVGDLITVSGDYNETAVNRISEYVEIEDETGKSAYPTLSMP